MVSLCPSSLTIVGPPATCRVPDRIAPTLFSEDAAQNLASLSRVAPLTFQTVADGHAGVTRDAKRKLERLIGGQ